MSRRQRTPRPIPDAIRFDIECDGSRSHSVRRIARVRLTPRPDLGDLNGGYAVRVEYVRVDDDPEDNDRTFPVRPAGSLSHMTRAFPCRDCGRDKKLRDVNVVALGLKLAEVGARRVRLREIP
ncbi:hypothetical protein [uncultured Phycicoccus sp.]|uniref:hypothetical protein n=1 Tax=uncultured Phycicoccus sp. TaxID=661422 RepID=UPI00262ADCB9|nr:hypothetical protein [uncultured Phycicoccus sp.]